MIRTIEEFACVLCTHCQKQLNIFERSMRRRKRKSQVLLGLPIGFYYRFVLFILPKAIAKSNPFIANYQIYRLPLKTIKILSSYLRFWFLIEHWAFHSYSLSQSANASAHTHAHALFSSPLLRAPFQFHCIILYTSFDFRAKPFM